jgi:murein DD-endopeptidase MepM/ murein hydrolase activator NlpD
MRRGVTLLGIVLLVAGFAAAAAYAGGTGGTTTTDTTTTATTSTTTTPSYSPLGDAPLPPGCVGAGVAAISTGDGAIAVIKLPGAGLGASEYPASNPYLTIDSAAKTGSGCQSENVTLTKISLFGGAVTATRVSGRDGRGRVTNLEVNGSPVTATAGETVAVGGWGLLTLDASNGRLSAPLALRLQYKHNSVAAKTTIFIGFAAMPQQPPLAGATQGSGSGRRGGGGGGHHPKHASTPPVRQPLTWTPRLGISTAHYVFPVDGGASYSDTYGAGRNDIYDGWHHGDDLFAPLGTPLVAVADGTLTLVGWNQLGGWRVWLTDAKGNSFYYAHMAGYSNWIIHHHHVKAGQVLGFLGRTGDAFPTPPHLHFEIHPHQLVKLGYDGAVDPTTYLQSWHVEHLPASKIPPAARLRAPAGTPSEEAAVVWTELLLARHLMPDGEPEVAQTPSLRRPFPGTRDPTFVDARRLASSSRLGSDGPLSSDAWPSLALGVALVALAAAGSFAFLRRRRST